MGRLWCQRLANLALRADGRNWNALQYASLELRQEPDLCLEAVQQRLGGVGTLGLGIFVEMACRTRGKLRSRMRMVYAC
jgi:hypothetical protein